MSELSQEPGVSAQLKKIADHLVFLEKKLDTLLEQSRNRKPYENRFGGYPQRNSSYTGHRPPARNYPSKYAPHRGAPQGRH